MDDEPLTIPDPGESTRALSTHKTLMMIQMLPSLRNGMTRKTVTGLAPLLPTPSVLRHLVVVNGSGGSNRIPLYDID